MLIAEIGNALGFVRMVRLGGLSYSSLASGYVRRTFPLPGMSLVYHILLLVSCA
jgi:hypothetical protein